MRKAKFESTKVMGPYSCCFRQWRAKDTHCRFLHGYGVTVKLTFAGELDERNWVMDFGGLRRAEKTIHGLTPKKWLAYMLDHTTLVAMDDPLLPELRVLANKDGLRLRPVQHTGAERFAEYLGKALAVWCVQETQGRVRLVSCEFKEHEQNSAIYYPEFGEDTQTVS